MDLFLVFLRLVLGWKLMLLFGVAFLAVFFLIRFSREEKIPFPKRWNGLSFNVFLYLFVCLLALWITLPFWIAGSNSAINDGEDPWFLFLMHLASKMHPESGLWNRALATGNDYLLLHGANLSLAKFYPYFFEVWQELPWIVFVNLSLMFLFTWKIQTRIFQVSRFMAFWGSLLSSLSQGLWGGAVNLHGLSSVPCILYILHTRFFSKKIYFYAFSLGILFALFSSQPLHTVPLGVMTIFLWLVCFFPKKLRRVIFLVLLFVLPILLIHSEYIFVVFQILKSSERVHQTMRPVGFFPFGIGVYLFALILGGLLLFGVRTLNLHKDPLVRKMVFLIAVLTIVPPTLAYLLQTFQVLPSYRWDLLYLHNRFPFILGLVFLADRIFRGLYRYNRTFGLWGWTASVLVLIVLCRVWFFDILRYGFVYFYHYGGWNYVLNNPILGKLKALEKGPFRVFNYGSDPDILFMGVLDGFETVGAATHLLNKDLAEFLNYLRTSPFSDADLINHPDLNLFVGEDLGDLSSIQTPLLKLLNVKYLFSKVPVQNRNFELLFYSPSVGEKEDCAPPVDIQSYFQSLKCLRTRPRYTPPFYVYIMIDPLPKVYMAKALEIKKTISREDLLAAVSSKKAFLREKLDRFPISKETFSGKGALSVKKYSQDSIELEVQTDSKQFLILSDAGNRFWRLSINEKPASFYDVNIVQTGFFVEPGASTVRFDYCPPRFLRPSRCQREGRGLADSRRPNVSPLSSTFSSLVRDLK